MFYNLFCLTKNNKAYSSPKDQARIQLSKLVQKIDSVDVCFKITFPHPKQNISKTNVCKKKTYKLKHESNGNPRLQDSNHLWQKHDDNMAGGKKLAQE